MAPTSIPSETFVLAASILGAHPSEIVDVEETDDGSVVTMVHGYSYHIAFAAEDAGDNAARVVTWFKPPAGYKGGFPRYSDEPSEDAAVDDAEDESEKSSVTIAAADIAAALGNEAFTTESVIDLSTKQRKEQAADLNVDGVNGNTAVEVVVEKFNQALYELSQK